MNKTKYLHLGKRTKSLNFQFLKQWVINVDNKYMSYIFSVLSFDWSQRHWLTLIHHKWFNLRTVFKSSWGTFRIFPFLWQIKIPVLLRKCCPFTFTNANNSTFSKCTKVEEMEQFAGCTGCPALVLGQPLHSKAMNAYQQSKLVRSTWVHLQFLLCWSQLYHSAMKSCVWKRSRAINARTVAAGFVYSLRANSI